GVLRGGSQPQPDPPEAPSDGVILHRVLGRPAQEADPAVPVRGERVACHGIPGAARVVDVDTIPIPVARVAGDGVPTRTVEGDAAIPVPVGRVALHGVPIRTAETDA